MSLSSQISVVARQPERLVGVDLLRALAIIQVIGVHLNNDYIVAPPFLPAIIVNTDWMDGVTLFFVVSGFLITRTIMQREPDIHRMSLRAFYVRRVARIQPLLLGSIALGALALALGWRGEPFMAEPHANFDTAFWTSLVTFSFNWLRIVTMQDGGVSQWGLHWDVMWSLSVEEQFYLLLPTVLILARTRRRFLVVLLTVIASCAAARSVAEDYVTAWIFSSFAGFDALGAGVLVALIAPRFDKDLGLLTMLLGLVLLVGGLLMPEFISGTRPLVVIVGGAVFILGAQARDAFFAGAIWKLPARIGALSYELYLLHPLVLVLVAPLFVGWSLGFGEALLLSVSIATVVAHFVETGFTKPMNSRIRRVLLRRRETVLAGA